MRIVITGATGFIGSNLAKLFLKKGAEVFVLVRPESTHLDVLPKDEKLHVVSCGLSNVMDCVSYIKEADAFFHLAWGGVNRQEIDSPEVQAKNVAGSLDCIRAAKALNCRMFMDAGSRVEYGLTDGNFTRRQCLYVKNWDSIMCICAFSVYMEQETIPGLSFPLLCGNFQQETRFL